MTDAVVISAADLGSNTVKIMHAMREFNGMVHPLSQATNTIRLGAGIESTGMIEHSRIDACIEFLVEQEQVGQALGSIAFVGVATEALRVASNGQDLLDRIADETSWEVRVIDGLEEARLTFVGLRDHLSSDAPSVIVDIGGGSTEIVVVDNNQPVWQQSLPLGSGRLADRFFDDDPPGMEATSQAFAAALEDLRVLDDVPVAVDTAVFAGGNGVFLQELIRQLYGDEPFTIHTTERILQHLSTTPASVTADQLGIMLERAEVFPAGVAVALAVITRTRASTALAVPSGIQPGIIKEFDATGR